jgi:hypothetical protein
MGRFLPTQVGAPVEGAREGAKNKGRRSPLKFYRRSSRILVSACIANHHQVFAASRLRVQMISAVSLVGQPGPLAHATALLMR